MTASELPNRAPSPRWQLYCGVGVIWVISLCLRFWQLGRLDPPVFDEIYFPIFAQTYLDGTTPFDVHPPLGKYIIAAGISLFGSNVIGYRVATAIAGSLIPVALAGLAYRLSGRVRFALLAGGLIACDGLFLVESRFGLMNAFLVLFGLLSQIFAISVLEHKGWYRWLLVICCGLMLGASAAVKWNGLGFWLQTVALAIAIGLFSILRARHWISPKLIQFGVWERWRSLRWPHVIVLLAIIPAVFYILQWLPHFLLTEDVPRGLRGFFATFGDAHRSILYNHTTANAGAGTTEVVHPYCSKWFSWPVLARPIGYFFREVGPNQWQDVHALGNPILWWSSSLMIWGLALVGAVRGVLFGLGRIATKGVIWQPIPVYCVIAYGANLLPWSLVSRCLFLYHYMSALTFAVLALAWGLDRSLSNPKPAWRWASWNLIAFIVIAAIFFLPIWMGWALTPEQFYRRMWFIPDRIPGFNWI